MSPERLSRYIAASPPTYTPRATRKRRRQNGGSFGSQNGRVTVGGATPTLDGLVTVEARRWDGYRDHSQQERQGDLRCRQRKARYAGHFRGEDHVDGPMPEVQPVGDEPDRPHSPATEDRLNSV